MLRNTQPQGTHTTQTAMGAHRATTIRSLRNQPTKIEQRIPNFNPTKPFSTPLVSVFPLNGQHTISVIDPEANLAYEIDGDFIQGIMQGVGKVTCYNERGRIDTEYSGNFTHGVLHGEGLARQHHSSSGDFYTEYRGNYNQGSLDGSGTIIEHYSSDFKVHFDAEFDDGEISTRTRVRSDLHMADRANSDKDLGELVRKDAIHSKVQPQKKAAGLAQHVVEQLRKQQIPLEEDHTAQALDGEDAKSYTSELVEGEEF